MSAPLLAETNLDLIFAWDHPRRRRFALMGFLAGSVLLHALCFYLFQIIYPPAVALLPPPGRVTVIAPNTEEGRVLLRWLEAEDPALASTTQPPAGGKSLALPIIQHAPSYLARQPALKDMTPPLPDPAVPSAQPPAPVALSHPQIPNVAKIEATIVRWSPDLEKLGTPQGPEMKFTTASRESPQAALFRVAIDRNGAVRYCFVEQSSGDRSLDEQARKQLALTRFPATRPPDSEIQSDFVWATVGIEWGNDVVAAATAGESVAP